MNRKRGRKSNVTKEWTQINPIMPQLNGQDCFFTEATFRRVMGPEPSFEEKILAQMRRIEKMKAEKKKVKKKLIDLDKPNGSDSDAPIQRCTSLNLRDRTLTIMDSTFDFVPDQFSELPTVEKKEASRFEPVLNKITTPTDQSDCLTNNEAGSENVKNMIVCDVEVPDEKGTQPTEAIAIVQELGEATDTKEDKDFSNIDLVEQPLLPVPSESSTSVNLNPGNDFNQDSQNFDFTAETITPAPPETILSKHDDLDKEEEVCLVMANLSDDDEELEVDLNANPDPSLSSPVSCSTEMALVCDKSCTINKEMMLQSNQSKENTETTESFMDTKVGIAITTDNINDQYFQRLSEDSQSNQYTASDSGHGVQQPAAHLPLGSSNNVTETHKWSEEDIPIFSVKAVEQQSPSAGSRKSRKIPVCPPEPGSSKTATPENVTQALVFKQSNLTRDEHAQYLKLYKKFVSAFSQGGLPPVLGSPQRKELAVFEKLQRQVLREQAEFQEYLKKNAERNPKFYQFLREPARNYSTSRIGAYRLQKGYANLFSSSLCDKISLSPGSGRTQMTFHQNLLQVGVPPTIKLPSIPKAKPPIRIPHNMKKINDLFPKFVKKRPHGFIHHDPVSSDVNAKVLTVKHNIQAVMSSSVVACLFNNQEPSYHHAWNIPVAVEECTFRGKISKVVYLDKPLFEDNLQIRDYNAIFHKYALRAFVSHAKKQDKRAVKIQGFEAQQQKAPSSIPVDDPFDMFNSSVTNLETFGTGTSSDKKSLCDKVSLPGQNVKTQAVNSVGDINRPLSLDERLAGSREGDGMGNSCHGKVLSLPGENATLDSVPLHVNPVRRSCVRSNHSGKSPAQISLGDKMDSTKQKSPCIMKEGLTGLNSGMATSLDSKSVLTIPPKTKQAEQNTSPLVTASSSSDTTLSESAKVLSPPKEVKDRRRGRKRKYLPEPAESHSEKSSESNNKESSPHEVASTTLDISSPLSPIASPPSSPLAKRSVSVHQVIQEIPSSPLLDRPLKIPSERIIPLSPNTPVTGTRANDRLQKLGDPTCNPLNNSHSDVKFISPLVSILGDMFEDNLNCGKTLVPKEDPSEFVQPLEECSSLHYNLWSLGDKKLLIRSSCHGIIKDYKKSRAVYLCPKLEYQTAHGLEQVTVDEMVKNWTACYVRQNTNLLRTRVNAFTSEILMYEELEPHKILQPSLNFKPHKAFQFLDNLLTHLTRLECGNYLLCHEPGTDYCGLKKKSVGSDSQLLLKHYPLRKRRAVDETIPWLPIDPTLLLPFHEEKKRIPATFMPKDFILENPGKKKNNSSHDIETNKKPVQKNKNKKKKHKNS